MPLKVSFELDDDALRFLRRLIREAREKAKNTPEREVTGAARRLLAEVAKSRAPQFVRERLLRLETLLGMLEDEEWAMAGKDRERVLGALAYFNEPEDLIPDDIPGVGYLDDAIVVELICKELEHEIEAYKDFCKYREMWSSRRPAATLTREDWLKQKRKQLYTRMRRRRLRRHSRSRTSAGRSPFSLF